MAVCRQCGSLKTQVVHGSTLERLIARALGQHVLICRECGWRGRGRTLPTSEQAPTHRRRPKQAAQVPSLREPVSPRDLDALDEALGPEPPKGFDH